MSKSESVQSWISPGSKSIINRVLTMAGMSRHPTFIKNFLLSDDTAVGIENLKKLGFQIEMNLNAQSGRGEVLVSPPDFQSLNKINFYDQIFQLNMGNSGTMARFFPAVVLNWTKTFPKSKPICAFLDANTQLKKRPIMPLIETLRTLGAYIEGDTYPFKIHSSNLNGAVEICTEQSSQFLSGLLMAGAGSMNQIEICRISNLPQQDYVLMTLEILKKFNVQVSYSNEMKYFLLSPIQNLFCREVDIEPDASTVCYFLALAFLHNFSLTIEGLGKSSLQPDIFFCDFLKQMGAHIELDINKISICKRNDSVIRGGFSYDFSLMSDQAITAGVLSFFANAPIEITNISHIRYHECDRIACLANNFKLFGFDIQETQDSFTVYPKCDQMLNAKGIWKTYDDHRFAMSGFLLSSKNSKIIIENTKCVSKTCPTFFEDMKDLISLNMV